MTIRTDDLPLQSTPHASRLRPRLFVWAAIIALAVVLVGFSRSYYLRTVFGTGNLSTLVHLHGFVMTLWFGTLVAQVVLVARGKIALHRRVGAYGMGVAVAVLVVGVATALAAARNGVSPGPPPLVFLAIPLGDMVVFATLIGLGFAYRRRGDYHKRFIIAASLGILTAAIARISFIPGGLPMFFGLTDLLMLGVVAVDSINNRRLHPAFAIGLAILILSQAARFLIAGTPQWLQFARWITG
jgi:hypothetical protein